MTLGVDVKRISPNVRHDMAMQHQRVAIGFAASFAMDLMKSGIHAGVPDGESASGERQYRILTVEELVDRSVAIAKRAFEAFSAEGWVTEVPPFEEFLHEDAVSAGFHQNGRRDAA